MPNTGSGAGGPLTCTTPPFSVVIVSPVLTRSSRPSATVSPAFAAVRFTASSPFSVNTPATRSSAPAAGDAAAVGDFPGQDAHDRELAAVRHVQRLHHVCARARVLELQALGRLGGERRFLVAQRLQQPQDAVAVQRPAAPGRSNPRAAPSRDRRTRGPWAAAADATAAAHGVRRRSRRAPACPAASASRSSIPERRSMISEAACSR